tara:strand:- start:6438 stop:6968 length:531 start_codon:yes stop_codon:yes gene_type:complete
MASTIQDFYQTSLAKQFSRDFLFRVLTINVGGAGLNQDDLVYARSASLPGRNIDGKVVNYFGQEFQVPGRSTYSNAGGYSIEFYHDENCDLRKNLEGISRTTFDNETSTGEYGMPDSGESIELQVINKGLAGVQNIKLVGVSIRDIGDVNYTIADGTGEVLNFPCTFAYHWYENFA